MRLREFIRENRVEIDNYIDQLSGRVPKTASCFCSLSGTAHYHQPDKRNDHERQEWVLSDEPLYRWAQSSGCRI